MIGNGDEGTSFLKKHGLSGYFWVYVAQLALWAVVVMDIADKPLSFFQWLSLYAHETSAVAHLHVITMIITIRIWRYGVKLFQERVMSMNEQRADSLAKGKAEGLAKGKAETANAIAVKLRERGMSEREVAEIVNGATGGDVASNGAVGNGSHGLGPDYDLVARVAAVAAVEAINRMRSSEEKADNGGKAEKPES